MGKNKGKKNKNKKGNNGKGSCNMNKNGQITNKKPKEKVEEEKELVIDIHLEKHNGSTKNSNFDQNFKYETRKFIDSVKRPEENKKRIIKENSKVEEEKVINKSESKEEKDDKALVNKKESQEKIRNKANPSIQRERSNNIQLISNILFYI